MKAIDAILFDPAGITVDADGRAFDDVAPALEELEQLGVKLIALTGASSASLAKAVADASLSRDRVIFLTDTEPGVRIAKEAGVPAVLMMNDPDEAMRLTSLDPAGGIVSLRELPDFVRFLLAKNS